jgi:hypothetical protein
LFRIQTSTLEFIACAPRNSDVVHSQRVNLALLGRHFSALNAEIDDNSHPILAAL